MANNRIKLLKILKAELEDLLEDIGEAEKRHGERFKRREITDYVYLENDALFRREAESVTRFLAIVDEIDITGYKTVGEIVSGLDSRLRDSMKDFEDPEAVYLFISRKLKKALAYIEHGDAP